MTLFRARVALLATLVLAAGMFLVPTDAHAVTGDPFDVPAKKTVEVDEGAVPGNDPASATADMPPDPSTCPTLPACMLVPFTIQVPERNPGDDFVVYLSMSWPQPTGQEDMDFWIYDNGQTQQAAGSSGYTLVGSSASGDMPEKVKLYEPLFGDYNLVANVFLGAIPSWHIKAESTVGVFEKPFESLAPDKSAPSTTTPTTSVSRSSTTTIATSTTVTVPEGVVIPDDDFDGGKFGASSQVDQAITSGANVQAVSAARAAALSKASPPNALTVVAWMLLLPAALIGAGFVALRARRRRGYSGASTSST